MTTIRPPNRWRGLRFLLPRRVDRFVVIACLMALSGILYYLSFRVKNVPLDTYALPIAGGLFFAAAASTGDRRGSHWRRFILSMGGLLFVGATFWESRLDGIWRPSASLDAFSVDPAAPTFFWLIFLVQVFVTIAALVWLADWIVDRVHTYCVQRGMGRIWFLVTAAVLLAIAYVIADILNRNVATDYFGRQQWARQGGIMWTLVGFGVFGILAPGVLFNRLQQFWERLLAELLYFAFFVVAADSIVKFLNQNSHPTVALAAYAVTFLATHLIAAPTRRMRSAKCIQSGTFFMDRLSIGGIDRQSDLRHSLRCLLDIARRKPMGLQRTMEAGLGIRQVVSGIGDGEHPRHERRLAAGCRRRRLHPSGLSSALPQAMSELGIALENINPNIDLSFLPASTSEVVLIDGNLSGRQAASLLALPNLELLHLWNVRIESGTPFTCPIGSMRPLTIATTTWNRSSDIIGLIGPTPQTRKLSLQVRRVESVTKPNGSHVENTISTILSLDQDPSDSILTPNWLQPAGQWYGPIFSNPRHAMMNLRSLTSFPNLLELRCDDIDPTGPLPKFKQLRVVDVTEFWFEHHPDAFSACRQLTSLTIHCNSRNFVSDVDFLNPHLMKLLQQLPSLHELNIIARRPYDDDYISGIKEELESELPNRVHVTVGYDPRDE